MNKVLCGDVIEVLKTIPDETVQCCVTSPPYWGLRDYGHIGQIGLEKTPEEYVAKMVEVFREVKRVLRKDGTLWLNLGDSYAGSGMGGGTGEASKKQRSNVGSIADSLVARGGIVPTGLKSKDLIGIPWRTAFALQSDGWWLRQDIIWAKPNPMPESVTDRCTKSHEYIFLLTKSARYYYDAEAIKEPAKDSSLARLGQDIENQEGSSRANGGSKTNGNMKAVKFGGNKAEGYGTRIHSGKEWKPRPHGVVRNRELGYDSKENELRGNIGLNPDGKRERDLPPPNVTANKRDVWTINTGSYSGAHFATFPTEIPKICIAAGSKKGDIVLDPFCGSGTTGEIALRMERDFIGIELNEKYVNELIIPRLNNVAPLFA